MTSIPPKSLVVSGDPGAIDALGVAVCISAIAAGMEWHAGLKARACNQLFAMVVAAIVVGLISAV